jgi:hypothetical protein
MKHLPPYQRPTTLFINKRLMRTVNQTPMVEPKKFHNPFEHESGEILINTDLRSDSLPLINTQRNIIVDSMYKRKGK